MGLSRRAMIALGTGAAVLVTAGGVWLVFAGPHDTAASIPAAPLFAPSVTSGVEPTTTELPETTMAVTTVPTVPVTTTTAAPVLATTVPARKPPATHTVVMPPPPVKPPADVPVPPPPHATAPVNCPPTYAGTRAANADVQSALVSAADTEYWTGVANPPRQAVDDGTGDGTSVSPTPTLGPRAVITVPPALLEAIAWQESGWVSNIVSCDGGHGVMQLQQATASWMNTRFGTSYDYTTLSGSAAIGGEYLEWLIGYFGENSFGHTYDMSDPDLVAAVIGAYNAGPASVQFANGHTVVSHYTATVEALMAQHPWG